VAAGTYLVNTIACVVFTVRVSRGAEDLRGAARLQRTGGMWLAFGALAYAGASLSDSAVTAGLIMLTAAGIHVLGELQQSAASFGIGFNLPPEHLQGQYQGVWSLGWGLMALAGPIWLTYLVFHLGIAGWGILAGQFVLLGLVTPWLVERALNDRRRNAEVA
jgi:MFS family permease